MTEAHVYKMTGNLKLKNAPPGPIDFATECEQ